MASNFKSNASNPKTRVWGVETGCYDVAHFLAEKECKSIIVTSGGPLIKYVRKKVKIIKLPVHLKNPLAIIFNTLALMFLQVIYRIDIVHARSRAPAWSCFLSTFLLEKSSSQHFMELITLKNKFKVLQ